MEDPHDGGFRVRAGDSPGFFPVTNESADYLMEEWGPYHFTVYAYLLRIINRKSGRGRRAVDTIAEKTGIGKTKVKEVLNDLDREGFIDRENATNPIGGRGVPTYTVYHRYQSAASRLSSGPQSGYDSRGNASTTDVVGETANGTNYFTVFCDQMNSLDQPVAPEDRKTLPRNLKLVSKDQSHETMLRVVKTLVADRVRGFEGSPQKALRYVQRGGDRNGGTKFEDMEEM